MHVPLPARPELWICRASPTDRFIAEVDAICQIEAKEEFRPKIVAFCCNWCSYAGADLAGSSRLAYPADVKIIRVPCSCRVNPMFILRAFAEGSRRRDPLRMSSGRLSLHHRKLLCKKKNDTACSPCWIIIGVENGRTRVEWVSAAEGVKFSQTMNEFVEKIHSLGKNVRLEDLRCKELIEQSERAAGRRIP